MVYPGGVTVVIVTWNRQALLRACLESLLNQWEMPAEVIVVDNGSTDGSAEMVERHFGGLTRPRFHLVRNPRNKGFAAANNQGIALASTRYIALLNNDAEADPGWIAELRTALDNDPTYGMAACKVLVWENREMIDKVGHLIYLDGQNRGRGTGERDQGQYDRQEEVLWPDGCAAMYRKEIFDRLGGFDEDFFAYAEDAELGLRARIAGWRCVYVPTAVVFHHRASTLGLGSIRRLRLIERNRVLLAAKLFPWSLLWRNPGYYLMRLAAGTAAAAAGKGEIGHFPGIRGKLRAMWALLSGDLQALLLLPRMWRKRLALEEHRKLSPSQVKQLLMAHRISLKTLSQQTTIPARRQPQAS